MFNSKIILPQDFFHESIAGGGPENNWLAENAFKRPEEQAHSFMEWIPFGRASQVVRRDFGELNDDMETSLNMASIIDLSPIRYHKDDDYSVSPVNIISEFDKSESIGITNEPIFKGEVYKGCQSLKMLPHPSQLHTKKSVKRKKPLGFDVDCHVQQILQKSKDLTVINFDERKVGSGIFPSPNHEYGLNPYRIVSMKRAKMDTNFAERQI